MKILALETSTAVCAAAIVGDEGPLAERRVIETHIHSEKLLTLVQEVCAESSVSLPAVDAIAVSAGPGSFTGLRIGVSAAKGLCFALSRPFIAVPTFEAIAEAAGKRTTEDIVSICLDARQGDAYVGRYRRTGGSWVALEPVAARPLADVSWLGDARVIVTDIPGLVRSAAPEAALLDAEGCCSAAAVGRIGIRMMRDGRTALLDEIEPMYLKDFVVRIPAGR